MGPPTPLFLPPLENPNEHRTGALLLGLFRQVELCDERRGLPDPGEPSRISGCPRLPLRVLPPVARHPRPKPMTHPQKTNQPAAPLKGAALIIAASPIARADAGLTAAHFTERELAALRNVCRDADNELASRMLRDAIARADAK